MTEIPAQDGQRPDAFGESRPRRRQITLRGLFGCTAYFAVSSALATVWGSGIFVLMNGVFLTWLSYRGYLGWMQTIEARPRVYGFAWFLFAISFALPAFTWQGCGNAKPQTQYGWQAALATADGFLNIYDGARELATRKSPVSLKDIRDLLGSALYVLFANLPNLLMLASPWLLYRQQRGGGRLLSTLFDCAAVSTWSWGVFGGGDLRIGYYVWSSGVTVISLARPPGWRSLVAMGVFGAVWLMLLLMG